MTDINKLTIQSWEEWLIISKWADAHVQTTEDELLTAFMEMENWYDFFKKFEEEKLRKKFEEYDKLQPAWFEYAPESLKKKREAAKSGDEIELMQWIQNNFSYNVDHTVNILRLNKTFCADITWDNREVSWESAQELEKTNTEWYKLMTDYNDTDTEEEKQQTDWYKLINIFTWNRGDDYVWTRAFGILVWCSDIYWTATKHNESNDHALARWLYYGERMVYETGVKNMVCGFKDSI